MEAELISPAPHQKLIFRTLIAIFIISLIGATGFLYDYLKTRQDIRESAKQKAISETQKGAQLIDDFMQQLPPLVKGLADDLTNGTVTPESLPQIFQDRKYADINIGVAFAPYSYDNRTKLYAPYYVRIKGMRKLVQIESFYDYTDPRFSRFNEPTAKGATFIDPFEDPASEGRVAEYVAPFFALDPTSGTKKLRGVVFANYSMDKINNIVNNLELGSTGYGFLCDKNTVFITHPDMRLVRGKVTLWEMAEQLQIKGREQLKNARIGIDRAFLDYVNIVTGQDSWLMLEPIKSPRWMICAVFPLDEIQQYTVNTKRKFMAMSLLFAIALIMLICLLLGVHRGETPRLWIASILTALLLGTLVGLLWYMQVVTAFYYKEDNDIGIIISDRLSLKKFIETTLSPEAQQHKKKEEEETTRTIDLQDNIDTQSSIHSTWLNTTLQTAPTITLEQPTEHIIQNIQKPHSQNTSTQLLYNMDVSTKQTSMTTPDQASTTSQASALSSLEKQATDAKTATGSTTPAIEKKADEGKKAPQQLPFIPIPTGIFIRNLEFIGGNSAKVTGQVWQRHPKAFPAFMKKGVTFPQAKDAKIIETYQFEDSTSIITGWDFNILLFQNFNSERYPFDSKKLRIQISPSEFSQKIVLIPDLTSYTLTIPTSLPGLNKNLPTERWTFEKSYFGYKIVDYSSNFGVYQSDPFGFAQTQISTKIPELYFNVDVRRNVFNAIILDLLPILLVIVILFIAMILASLGLFAPGYLTHLGSSLFFSVLLSHLRFKTNLETTQVVFFDYFFFMLHANILAVVIICIIFTLDKNIRWISYKNLLIPMLLYWPMITLVWLTISLIYFF